MQGALIGYACKISKGVPAIFAHIDATRYVQKCRVRQVIYRATINSKTEWVRRAYGVLCMLARVCLFVYMHMYSECVTLLALFIYGQPLKAFVFHGI